LPAIAWAYWKFSSFSFGKQKAKKKKPRDRDSVFVHTDRFSSFVNFDTKNLLHTCLCVCGDGEACSGFSLPDDDDDAAANSSNCNKTDMNE
jgi:hypothetical protein